MHTPQEPGSLWRHGDFLKLWAGQTISLVGSDVTLLALPLTAVLTLDASAAQMGVLRAVQYVPAILFGLFAGVWIDRLRRRPIMIVSDLGRAILLGSIPLALAVGLLSMPYLYVVGFVVGTLTVLFEVAYQAFLPTLVRREHLVEANGKLEASRSVGGIVGPGLAGALVQVVTAPVAMLADALSFLVSVLSLGLLRTPEPPPAPHSQRGGTWQEIGEGLRMILGHPLLRPLVITSAIFNLFAAILNSLAVLYEVRGLGFSPAAIGAVGVVASITGLVGAILTGMVTRRLGVGRTIVLATLLIGGGWALLPLASGPRFVTFPLVMLGASVGNFGDAFYNINVGSLRQAVTPDRLLGRVTASGRFIIWGVQPVGALLGGVLGEHIGLRWTLGVTVAGFLLGFLWTALSSIRRLREAPAPAEPEGAPAP